MMQAAALFGVYTLSLLAVLLFASPFAIWAPRGSGLARSNGTALLTLVFSVALALGAAWGAARLQSADMASTGVRLRIVQANVDQANKWRPENSVEIFSTYLDLTKSGGLDGISLVVWPETAVPFFLAESAQGADRDRRCPAGRHELARRLGKNCRGARRTRSPRRDARL
jgi:apolipoprotein N-acyltransferase